MRKRIFGFILVVVGLLIMAYPLKLRFDSRADQNKLIEDFKTVNTSDESDGNQNKKKEEDNQTITYDSWPETLINIPKLKVEAMVVEMDDSVDDIFKQDVNYPPAHYPSTDLPGGDSNVAIAAHRTGPADFFRHLDKLKKGDVITLTTKKAVHKYLVEKVFVVDPTDVYVIDDTDYGALTLTSCERVGRVSNKKRIIVRAKLV